MNIKRQSATENTEFTEGKSKSLRTCAVQPPVMPALPRSKSFSVFSVPSVARSEV